jgi:hypothetical protein
LRAVAEQQSDRLRIAELVGGVRADLAARPLYISVDKDVLCAEDAAVNWDSGCLRTAEALEVVRAFAGAARGRLAGMDVVGDWSPVQVQGLFRRTLHWAEHPRLRPDPAEAAARNERLNLAFLQVAAGWFAADTRPTLMAA